MQVVRIEGARLLSGEVADIAIDGGRLARHPAGPGLVLDARGLLLAPALVDIHGDAFERSIQPRPGVDMPLDLAIAETEAALLAAGIATAFHGVTLSWEPGLRCEAAFLAWLAALDRARPRLVAEHRIHLRFEAFNLPSLPTALDAIERGRVQLLAFNDHTASILRKLKDPAQAGKYAGRAGMDVDEFAALAGRIAAREAEVEPARLRLAEVARAHRLPMLSHDDQDEADRARFRALGATLCEFPVSESAARGAAQAGEPVIMGAPNVVRGGSHTGWISAGEMVRLGLCTVLASDYHYPSMAAAAFRLAREGYGLEAAWSLVSDAPARAAGLADRGRIEPGLRADLTLWADTDTHPRLVATLVQGRIGHLTAEGARLRSAAFATPAELVA